jgi:antitoxin Phd
MKKQPRKKDQHTAKTKSSAIWQLRNAKVRIDEVIRRARTEGPQWIVKENKETVVVLAAEEYERLIARVRQPKSLVEFFAQSPLVNSGINLARVSDCGRPIKL